MTKGLEMGEVLNGVGMRLKLNDPDSSTSRESRDDE